MGMEEALAPGPNFNRPVKDLVYNDLLTSTFTQTSHDRGIKTWRTSSSYPQCVFCGNKFRYEAFNVECHMDPNIGKATIGKERTAAACKESLPTSCGPHRNRFLEVQAEIRARMASDKKNFACRSECIGKTQPDFGWRLCRHSCACRCSR